MSLQPPQKVTRRELRAIFNDPEYQQLLFRRCTQRVYVYDELAPAAANEPPGTLSQVYDLYDRSGVLLATLHEYKRPDGTIGASGMKDPYFLLVNEAPWIDP